MTKFDISKKQGVWFEMEGGGRIQLRTMTADDFKIIRRQTVSRKVEYKRVEGKAERFEIEEVKDDLQTELFWDYIIVGWENLYDGKEVAIPCTKENKMLLLSLSAKFLKFVTDCLQSLNDTEAEKAESAIKNS